MSAKICSHFCNACHTFSLSFFFFALHCQLLQSLFFAVKIPLSTRWTATYPQRSLSPTRRLYWRRAPRRTPRSDKVRNFGALRVSALPACPKNFAAAKKESKKWNENLCRNSNKLPSHDAALSTLPVSARRQLDLQIFAFSDLPKILRLPSWIFCVCWGIKIDDDFSVYLLHSLFIISLRFNSQGGVGRGWPQHGQTKSQVISQSQSQQRREEKGDEDGQETEAKTRAMKYLETIASGKDVRNSVTSLQEKRNDEEGKMERGE